MIHSQTPGTLISPQRTGWSTGATKQVTTSSRHEAILLFQKAKMRLLNVNRWQDLCGPGSAEFRITDRQGNPLNTLVADKGNLIRINLPAPDNEAGSGYDWVIIEAFEQSKEMMRDEESYGFRVRPVPNPTEEASESAHFYTSESTSTFLIVRRATNVIAMERGRNEKPNTKGIPFFNKLRNITVAFLAMVGLSKPQWQTLVDGFLAKD